MTTPTEAGRIVTRLAEHWPTIAAGDYSAQDWIHTVRTTPDPDHIAALLIQNWDRDRPPRIADWRATARQHHEHTHREHTTRERQALESADRPVPADRIIELIAAARAQIHPTPPRTPNFRGAVSYTMIPTRWGDPGTTMTVEEHDKDAARFQRRIDQRACRR